MPQATNFTDFASTQDSEGIFDILIDAGAGDFVTTDAEDSAIVVSLFSDRRAFPDEVADPMKRRGWIGDEVAEVTGDRHGSGLWLYEQRRLTPEVANGVRMEAVASLQWMVEQGLVTSVAADVVKNYVVRSVTINITCALPSGGTFSEGYVLANNTRTGLLAQV
jgi:phage gp46-like protein